jgi:hypothetical protein
VREDNDEGITKHESRTAWKLQYLRPFWISVSSFGFVSSFVIRISSFH